MNEEYILSDLHPKIQEYLFLHTREEVEADQVRCHFIFNGNRVDQTARSLGVSVSTASIKIAKDYSINGKSKVGRKKKASQTKSK